MTTPDEVYELAAKAYADGLKVASASVRALADNRGFRAAVDAAFAAGRRTAAEAILAHADKHVPAPGNEAQARMRRHLMIAARVAEGPMTVEEVAAALQQQYELRLAVDAWKAGQAT